MRHILPDVYLIVFNSAGVESGSTPSPPVSNAPVIDSLSETSGQIGDFVTFTGSYFSNATDVSFNGAPASFSIIDDNSILATVPSGATTGAVSVTNSDGTGTGPVFTVDANNFAFNLDTATLPSGLTGTRSGGTLYLARSGATSAVATTGSDVYEDRTDGKGQWTFPAYQNRVATPTDLSGWTNNVAVLTSGQTDPTGGTAATKVQDANAGVVASIYSPDPSADGYDPISSVWVRDDVSDPPDGNGVITVTDAAAFPKGFYTDGVVQPTTGLGSGTSWRRAYVKAYTSGGTAPPRVLLSPSGQTPPTTIPNFAIQDATKLGSRYFFMPMSFGSAASNRPPFNAPSLDGTSTKRVIAANTPANAIVGNGDLDLEGSLFFPDIPGSQNFAEVDIVTVSVGGVITKLYLDQSIAWHAIFKDSAPDGQSITFGRPGQLIYWRLWYKPSEGSYGWSVRFNGAIAWVQANGSPGAAIGTPTIVNLGADEAGNNVLPAMHTLLRRSDRLASTAYNCEGVVLGDSTMAPYQGVYMLVASGFYTATQAAQRQGILSLATTAQTSLQQLSQWQASQARGNPDTKWLSVQVGINDIGGGANATTLTSRIQSIIDDANTNNPGMPVILVPMIPWGQNFNVTQLGYQTTVNAELAGGGGFTGSNLLYMPLWSQLDDGSGSLKAEYQTGDGHDNDDARVIMAGVYHDFLTNNGLL